MDTLAEQLFRRASFAFACALIGKFMTMHRERYGSDPKPAEITNFCLNIMLSYDGSECSINSDKTEKLITEAMEKAHKTYEDIASPFEKLTQTLKVKK